MKRLLLVLLLPLAACQGSPVATMMESQESRDARADAQCRSYGAQPGTDIYIQCRSQMAMMQMQERSNARSAIQQAGAQMQANAAQQQAINAMNRPVTCNSSVFGRNVTTNCF